MRGRVSQKLVQWTITFYHNSVIISFCEGGKSYFCLKKERKYNCCVYEQCFEKLKIDPAPPFSVYGHCLSSVQPFIICPQDFDSSCLTGHSAYNTSSVVLPKWFSLTSLALNPSLTLHPPRMTPISWYSSSCVSRWDMSLCSRQSLC